MIQIHAWLFVALLAINFAAGFALTFAICEMRRAIRTMQAQHAAMELLRLENMLLRMDQVKHE